ncbi:ead/Ea22-like family protein [Salmonella enterica]|nr:ead/Ea22-like family protein [Salmonella enterica]
MSNIDKQALREEFRYMRDHYNDPADRKKQEIYIAAEALLDELDKKQQYIKLRDQENEDIALTVGKLRVELEAAKKRIAELEKGHQEAAKQINSWRRLAKQNIAERGKDISELEAARQRIAEQSAIVAAAEKLVRCKGRYHSELNYRALAKLFGVNTPDLPPMDGESRTVMMPEPFKMAKSSSGLMYYYADEVDKALAAAGIGVKQQEDSVDSDAGSRNQPGMVVAVHVDAGDFVKVKGQVFEVEETDFDDHDVTLWFVGGNALRCAAGCPVEVVSAPVAAGIKVKG